MKHYLWYKTDGTIGGTCDKTGGWASGEDPSEATPTDVGAAAVKAATEAYADFAGWIAYDCGCGTEVGFCSHGDEKIRDSYSDAGTLTAMPAFTLDLDASTVSGPTFETPLDKATGACTLKIVSATVPDGATVKVTGGYKTGPALHDALPVTLTFTSGETDTVALNSPPVGLTAGVNLQGKYVFGALYLKGA